MTVHVQEDLFDLHTIAQKLKKLHNSGASVTFEGYVRDFDLEQDKLDVLELEHYPGMTEKSLEEIINQARGRWDLYKTLVIHRVGPLLPEDQIVLVAVTSAHRGEAFSACEFIMDYLKTAAPFWKKEETPEGSKWVDARVTDDAAMARWKNN